MALSFVVPVLVPVSLYHDPESGISLLVEQGVHPFCLLFTLIEGREFIPTSVEMCMAGYAHI